jgi:hypothetical protein
MVLSTVVSCLATIAILAFEAPATIFFFTTCGVAIFGSYAQSRDERRRRH